MALDVANLGFQVDSSALRKATTDLNAMAGAATKAAPAVDEVGTAAGRAGQGVDGLGATTRGVGAGLSDVATAATATATAFDGLGASAPRAALGLQEIINRATGVSAAARTASASTQEWVNELNRQAAAFNSLRASVDPVFAASQRYEAAVEGVNAAVKAGIVSQTEANRVLDMAAKSYLGAGQAVQASNQAAVASGGIFQRYGSQIQNTSYQVQDMVVQISMGTDAMRAMSMQLPQMLGGFGAWGAVIGVAVGVLGGLVPMLMGAKEEADQLDDTLRDLTNAQTAYSDAVDLAKTSLSDLYAEFGRNALAARELYSAMRDIALLEYAQQITKSTQALKGEIDGINRLVAMHQSATTALNYSAKTAFALNAQAVKELRDEYGLTIPQAQKLTAALDDIDNASTVLEQANGMKAFADAIAEAVRNGAEVPPHILAAAREAADLAAQGFRVADAIAQASDNTGAAITNTNSWAVAMSGVAAQINAIASALSSIGGGMLTRVSAFVERNALAAGKSVAEARIEVEKFKASAEWDAQIMGARGKGGILGAVQERALEAAKAIDIANIEMTAENAILVQNAQASERAAAASAKKAGGSKAAGKAAKGAAKDTRDLIGELHRELDARQALIGLYGEERARVEALQQVQSKLGDDIGKYSREAIQAAADRIVAVDKETKAWEDHVNRIDGLTDDLAGAWGDWIAGGLRDFKDFAGNILKSFQRMISEMIATAAANPIRLAITGAMGGFGGAGGAMAGVPGMGGTGGILGSIGSTIGSALSGVMGGFGSVVSGLFSGGLGGAAGALTTALGGATSGLAGLATAAGAIAAPLAAVAAVFSFFSSKTKELDRGLRVTVAGMDTLVEAYRRTEKSRFWGLSKKRRTRYEEADDAVADPIEDYVAKMQEAVLKAAESLGVGTSAFETFAYQVKMSTKGMTDEEAVQHIQEEMTKLGDAFAGLVPDLAQFAQEGEGAMATLDRLATSFSVVNGALGDLGLALYEASVSGAGAAASFAELFGSLDAFQQAAGAYYQSFYTEQERLTRLRQVSQQAIRDAGLAVPATREAYRQLVEAQDLSTEAGREAVAVLLQLAPAFDQIYGAAEQAAGSAADLTRALAEAAQTQAGLLRDTLTPTQQAAADQARMAATYERLGIAVPQTIAAYRALIQGLDLTTESGRATLAALASVSGALLDTFDAAGQAAQAAREAAEEARKAAEEAAKAARDAWVGASSDLAKMLRETLTPDQQVIADQERMARVFRDLGVAVPSSVTAYRDLIRSLDLTTEAGRAALAAINGVSGALLDTFDAARRAAEDARRTAEDAHKAAQEAAQAARQAWVDASTERARLLRETLTPDQQAAADQAKLRRVFDQMGLAVPQTMAAYREILKSLDLTTESGREALERITSVSDTLLQSLNALGEAQKARQDLLVSLMTDQQRAAYEQEQITAVFRDLGAQVPTTLAGLQAFIAGLDLTGEAGRAALERITGIADALRDSFGAAGRSEGTPGERMSDGRANNIAEERERLERQLLELQGNTLEIRRRELAAINPANRALQEMVWRLEDAKEAMDNLTTDGFATLVDFELARARAANVSATPTAAVTDRKAEEARQRQDSAVLVEMRDYMRTQVNEVHRLVRETREMRMLQEGVAP